MRAQQVLQFCCRNVIVNLRQQLPQRNDGHTPTLPPQGLLGHGVGDCSRGGWLVVVIVL